ncbi:prepilin peptidase [Sphingomonas sp. MMS12-HWE2-04]|uniref:A24 family peptidase n=1 Tax=Sphingomonas sp. MMS12-HWE2-04 TaxID=3234199 RepID=UPI00384D3305
MGVVAAFSLAALALLLVSCGIQDAKTREIANWKNAAIACLAPLWWWANGLALWPDIAIQIGIAIAVFLVFFAAFCLGQMGGGDVKMLGALALWLPLQPLIWMLILMSLLGGALTIVLLVEQKIRRREAVPEIPYGVAIAIAALLVFREPILNQFQ